MNFHAGGSDLHPILGAKILVSLGINVLAKGKVSNSRPSDIMPGNFLKHRAGGKGHFAAQMRQSPMGWHKG